MYVRAGENSPSLFPNAAMALVVNVVHFDES